MPWLRRPNRTFIFGADSMVSSSHYHRAHVHIETLLMHEHIHIHAHTRMLRPLMPARLMMEPSGFYGGGVERRLM